MFCGIFQGTSKSVELRMFHSAPRVFQRCFKFFKGVSMVFYGRFMGVSMVISDEGCFKVVSRGFKGCFQ